MSVNGIKTRKYKVNPSLTCENQTNKQTNMWKRSSNHEYMEKKDLKQKHYMWNKK